MCYVPNIQWIGIHYILRKKLNQLNSSHTINIKFFFLIRNLPTLNELIVMINKYLLLRHMGKKYLWFLFSHFCVKIKTFFLKLKQLLAAVGTILF